MTKWFQVKEHSAGNKRLLLTWLIYKYFGEIPVRIIAFTVAFGTFMYAKDLRRFSKNYFTHLFNYTNEQKYKPSMKNSFKHFLSYANSLVDKMIAYTGNFNINKITFAKEGLQQELSNIINKKQGSFFITTHIGNIEMLKAFIFSNQFKQDLRVNVFLQKNMCVKFNNFIDNISKIKQVELFPIEDITIDTSMKIKEKLENGEFVFMAGDRISMQTQDKYYEINFLNQKIHFPSGILKFALMLDCPIYFITCAIEDKKYVINFEKFTPQNNKKTTFEKIKKEFGIFFEKSVLKYPYQFYHFYDIFATEQNHP